MTSFIKYGPSSMKSASKWEKEEISIASLATHASSDVSVGLDSGSIWLIDNNLKEKGQVLQDQAFPIIDHFWTQKNHICYTQGKNIVLYDAEKQKPISNFVSHTDVLRV
jgi:hypothetical protein